MNAVAPDQPPRPRRSGWLWLAKLCAALVILGAIALVIWFHSEGDLRAIRAAISEAGLPTTAAELGRKRSAADRCALLEQLDLVLKRPALSGWAKSSVGSAKVGEPLAAEILEFVAGLPATDLHDLDVVLEKLGTDPVVPDDDFTLSTRVENYRAVYLLRLRAMTAAPQDLPLLLDRLHACVLRQQWASSQHAWSRIHALDALLHVLNYRLPAVSDELRPLWAERVRACTAEDASGLLSAQRGDLVKELDFFTAPWDRMRRAGVSSTTLFEFPVIGDAIMRAGRGAFLRRELQWAVYLQAHSDLREIRAEAHRRFDVVHPLSWLERMKPSLWVGAIFSEYHRSHYIDRLCTLRLQALVLAAVLRNESMPADWFDPAGLPVRPFQENGQLRGYYSVGVDGKDDGGDQRRDLRWTLFAATPSP